MRSLPLIAGLAALGVAGLAATPAEAQRNERVYVVYGDDPCPKIDSDDDEIVVCARRPEEERYRVPKRFREKAISPENANESWAVRSEALNDAAPREGPGSCSVNGPGGWTGCWAVMMRQAQAERRQAARERAAITPARGVDAEDEGEE